MTPEQAALLADWLKRLKTIYRAHYGSAIRTANTHYVLGIITILLSSSLGARLFFTTGFEATPHGKLTLGIAGLVVACLTAIQTFVKLPEKAEQFKEAGARFASLHREVEQFVAAPHASPQQTDDGISAIRQKFDEIATASPTAIPAAWRAALRRYLPNDISSPTTTPSTTS